MTAELATAAEQISDHPHHIDSAESLRVLTIANDGDPETVWLHEPGLSDVVASLERLRAKVATDITLAHMLDLIRVRAAFVAVLDAVDDGKIGAVGVGRYVRAGGETTLRMDIETGWPVDPASSELLAYGLEDIALQCGCQAVRVSAFGPFPCPRGYEFEDLGDGKRVMTRRLDARN